MLNPLVVDLAFSLAVLALAAWIVTPVLTARPVRAPNGRAFPRS